jgi:2'-5' RNA ligase
VKIAAFLAGILFLISPCFAAPLVCPPDVVDSSGTGKAVLFSSLPLDKTDFAVRWSSALPELKKEFPTLRFEKTENLHITLAFMGVGGWNPAKVEEMERYALDGPDYSSGAVTLKGSPDLFGPKKNVVVLHFTAAPPE